MKFGPYFLLVCLLFSCTEQARQEPKSQTEKVEGLTELERTAERSWRNPAMFPHGASLANTLRAYYLVGEFEKMLPFLILPPCYPQDKAVEALRDFQWGYAIHLTNVQQRQADSTFVLSYRTRIAATIGLEQYLGKVVQDTAKLYFFPDSPEVLQYKGETDSLVSTNYCR